LCSLYVAPPKPLAHSQRLKRLGEWTRRPDLVVVEAEEDVEADADGEVEKVAVGVGGDVESEAAGEAEKVEVVVGGVITVAVVTKVTWRGRPRGRGGWRGGERVEEWNGLRR
jgi:hypothetical protein